MSVVYKDPRTLKKVSIPDIKGSEVELWNNLLWGDLQKIYEEEGSDVEKGTKALVCLIKSWNLTDEKESPLPIDENTLKTFTVETVNFLLSQTDFGKEGVEALKKKS